jgi:hypothetical protein
VTSGATAAGVAGWMMTAVRASAPPVSRVPYSSSHEPDLVRTREPRADLQRVLGRSRWCGPWRTTAWIDLGFRLGIRAGEFRHLGRSNARRRRERTLGLPVHQVKDE